MNEQQTERGAIEDALCDALMAARHGRYDGMTVEMHLENLIERLRLWCAMPCAPTPAEVDRLIDRGNHARLADCVFPRCTDPTHWPTDYELGSPPAKRDGGK